MAPPNQPEPQPNQPPPKRDPPPAIPTVGVGKDQVLQYLEFHTDESFDVFFLSLT